MNRKRKRNLFLINILLAHHSNNGFCVFVGDASLIASLLNSQALITERSKVCALVLIDFYVLTCHRANSGVKKINKLNN